MKEAMKRALEALQANYELINGRGNHFGLEGAMDGYYSGCFDVEGTNKKTEESIKALEEALKQEYGEPAAWAEEIIDDFHALYNSEMIKENDSGDELIRLDAAVCAVEEAAQRHTTPPQPKQEQEEPIARVTSVYAGRFTYAPINSAVVLPVGMALYMSPPQRT